MALSVLSVPAGTLINQGNIILYRDIICDRISGSADISSFGNTKIKRIPDIYFQVRFIKPYELINIYPAHYAYPAPPV